MTDATASRLAGLIIAAGVLALAAGAWLGLQPAVTPAPVVLPAPAFSSAAAVKVAASKPAAFKAQAEFGTHRVSAAARRIAAWAAEGGDAQGRAFMIVDKKLATLYVFAASGGLVGTTPVLLGSARGDASVPGIGQRKVADVRPFERTTPAGRFVTAAGRNLDHEPVIWIDYDAAVSMHSVRATVPSERRLARLASPSAADNRISYGCINVPLAFFESVVWPAFSGAPGVVYVLPDTRPLDEVFAGL